ncbi:MAG TPA: hypothetical protein VJV78_31545 [Polyangiales bacterium]|nr:hypothetical protein [Polyangiales bacterium]
MALVQHSSPEHLRISTSNDDERKRGAMATAENVDLCPWCDAPFDGFDCRRCDYTPSLRFRVPLRAIYTLLLLVFVLGFAIGIHF